MKKLLVLLVALFSLFMLSGCEKATKSGNYIVFFPSYQYLEMVSSAIEDSTYELIVQKNTMSEEERLEIINKFKNTTNCKVGLFVMGGIFSEGIDFIGDSLNGVIIVGVGLPLICDENNILKDYFDKNGRDGYKYAYMYPGMNKVLQACGRVIRTETDRGVILLLDERFLEKEYEKLYPREWNKIFVANMNSVSTVLDDFWNDKWCAVYKI